MIKVLDRLFGKTPKPLERYNEIDTYLLYQNNHVVLVHDAAKLCYSMTSETNYSDMLNYIGARVKEHHESILEHSNIIMILSFEDDISTLVETVELISSSKYLNYKLKRIGKINYLLIGGSFRGYKNIFRNIVNQDNHLAKELLLNMYNFPKEYFLDFIEDCILEEKHFPTWFYENSPNPKDESALAFMLEEKPVVREFTKPGFTIAAFDNLDEVEQEIRCYTQCQYLFTEDDLLDMCTVTVYMKDISRIITQQITRHDNATSQRSQRWVDERNAKYRNPLDFQKYLDKNTKFKTSLGELTLDELAEKVAVIYGELRDQGLHKEDARMFLTNNTLSDLYMTFTYRNLFWFLKLREDSHTQGELRTYSIELRETIDKLSDYLEDSIYDYLKPKYKKIEKAIDDETLYTEEVTEE